MRLALDELGLADAGEPERGENARYGRDCQGQRLFRADWERRTHPYKREARKHAKVKLREIVRSRS